MAKKEAECIKVDKSRDTSDFCAQYFEMMDIIQDDGLIFAEGDRDNLLSAHGKTYCSYLLLKKYLNESVIFSRYTDVPDIFLEQPKPAVQPAAPSSPIPAGNEEKPAVQTTSKVDGYIDPVTATF